MIDRTTRRTFLGATGAALASARAITAAEPLPWYRRSLRWGQTNITEMDPVQYDIAWWREYWKRTQVQGVIINAGGIFAYYPSKFPLHHRAEFLNGRDLYGELARAAHEDGLAVFARMDSNRAAEDFYRAHPDWFARDAGGNPYRAADRYVTCVNSPYYDEYIPGILREIIERTHPEGLTDNSWSGLGRDSICYCANCERKFGARAGKPVPRRHDWNDPVYREWIRWNYERRLEIWDLNNRTAQSAGGPDCLWVGMNSGSVSGQSRSFRDLKEICKRAEIIMLDQQARSDAVGFQQNGDTGKLIHNLLGWDKLIPESMAMYQNGRTNFRVASKPAAEARMWMIEGFAGGIQPWWHHVGAYHEDRRMYRTAEPVMRWHKANEEFLVNRRPVATVGLLWSQQNTDFYGRDAADELVDQPYRGMMQALIRARIPYLPLHADYIDRDAAGLAVLILPNLAAMSDAQCAAVRRFVERGGALFATGDSSLYNEWGDPRPDFALADLFGAHAAGSRRAGVGLVPDLPALEPRVARAGVGPQGRQRTSRGGRAPSRAARFRRDGHPAVWRSARGHADRPRRDRAPDLHPVVPGDAPRNRLDARAEDRHPGLGVKRARQGPDRLHARRHRPPLQPRESARPRQPARQHRALGGRRRHPAGRGRTGPDRLPPLRAVRQAHPSPGEPDQRGHLARAPRGTDSCRPVQGEGAPAAEAPAPAVCACWFPAPAASST